jgi:thiamine-phosphate pyrophosphorylase
MKPRRLPDTDIYAILSSAHCLGRSNVEVARRLLAARVKIIQYREKDFPMRQKYAECLAIRKLCREYDACFIVNDDAAVAAAVGADGLHLGQDDLPPAAARKVVGEEMLIGLSVATPAEVNKAVKNPAIDYLGVGPIFDATATKPDAAAPAGQELLDYAVLHSRLPVVAIGGITLDNVADVTRRGARCLAMISDLVGAEDIAQRVADLRAVIAACRPI